MRCDEYRRDDAEGSNQLEPWSETMRRQPKAMAQADKFQEHST